MVSSDEDSALVKKEGQVDSKEDLEAVALRETDRDTQAPRAHTILQDPLNPDNDPELVAWRQESRGDDRCFKTAHLLRRKMGRVESPEPRWFGSYHAMRGLCLQVPVEGGHSAGHVEARQKAGAADVTCHHRT